MRTAWLTLRDSPPYRRDAFEWGLKAAGYQVRLGMTMAPKPGDVLIIWNRYGAWHKAACEFEHVGASVLVCENGYLGRDWMGENWYAIALNQHNGAGVWKPGGPERWEAMRVHLRPWRTDGDEIVILPQRGIGPAGVRMPDNWLTDVAKRLRGCGMAVRVRQHPGERKDVLPLMDDLERAWAVVTWGSGAAVKALVHGIPVFYDLEHWLMSDCGTRTPGDGRGLTRVFPDRRPAFERMAWAMWRLDEIAAGDPFRHLLGEG